MSDVKIIGNSLPNIPWENRPDSCLEPVWRYSKNPIMGRNKNFNAKRVYNSAVVPFKGGFAGVFRADGRDGTARLFSGVSPDGINFTLSENVIQWKDEQGNPWQPNYAYDPRVILLEGRYYIVWCVDGGGAALGMGVTDDFVNFTRLENPFIPFNRNGVLFPRKIGGKYHMLTRPSDSGHTPFGDIHISQSPDLIHWGMHRLVMRSGGGWWQGTKIGGGTVIETSEGWLLLYHGVSGTCNGFVYSMGAAILDIDQPSKVLYRSTDAILPPEMPYETTGFVDNVIFPCAALTDSDTGRIAIYYGCADTHTGIAFTDVNTLVEFVKATNGANDTDRSIGRV